MGALCLYGFFSRSLVLVFHRAFINLVNSIRLGIGQHGLAVQEWKMLIDRLKEDPTDVEKTEATRRLIAHAANAVETLGALLGTA